MVDTLLELLTQNKNPILFEPRTSDLNEIKARLECGEVLLEFVNTSGGTELNVKLDTALSQLGDADFKEGVGKIGIIGRCELNFQSVQCTAEIDLSDRRGEASLEILTDTKSNANLSWDT